MHKPHSSARDNARGAVFVEKLIVFLPVLATFFMGWELAEIGAANIIVQRASAAAGRAAMVVLPDDPLYYAGEPTHSYAGARRADVELAAGMVLSAVPQIGEDFEVEVSDPPSGFGTIDVTVRAPYRCGSVGLICGLNGTLALSARTAHAYHGAAYEYAAAGGSGGLGSSQHALSTRGGDGPTIGSKQQALGPSGRTSGGSRSGGASAGDPSGSGSRGGSHGDGSCDPAPAPLFKCGKGKARDQYLSSNNIGPNPPSVSLGSQLRREDYRVTSGNATADGALAYRCKGNVSPNKNVAAIKYRCTGDRRSTVIARDSDAGFHSERNVYRAYLAATGQGDEVEGVAADAAGARSCTIEGFYTEREPCTDRCRDGFFGRDHPTLAQHVSYTFKYPPKFGSFDPRSDPYYARHRTACTSIDGRFNTWETARLRNARTKKNPSKDPGAPEPKMSCGKVGTWARANGESSQAVADCMEYQQALQDAADFGPRGVNETANRKQIKAMMDTKECKALRASGKGTKRPANGDPGTSRPSKRPRG